MSARALAVARGVALLLAAPTLAPLDAQQAQQAQRASQRARTLVIDDATIVDVAAGRVVPSRRILIRGDSIVAVEPMNAPEPAAADERLDARGAYVIPGLVDHHVHLIPGMAPQLERAVRGGVTLVQNMAGDNRTAGEYARAARAREIVAPEIAYASVMAGPDFFTDPRFVMAGAGYEPGTAPWIQAVRRDTDLRLAVAAARGSGAEVLKLYAMLDSATVSAITAEAHRQGMRVVAHATVFPARPTELVASDVDILTHAAYLAWQGSQGIGPVDAWRRRDGPFASNPVDGPATRALLGAMARRGTSLEPTLLITHLFPRDAAAREWAAAVTRAARDAGVTILAGTDMMIDTGATALPNIHRELEKLVEAGLTPREALAAATIAPVRAMRRERTHGAVAAGRVADLVLLESDPLADIRATTRIRAVIHRGRVLAR